MSFFEIPNGSPALSYKSFVVSILVILAILVKLVEKY